jgi:dipeptidyl-peptidase-3
MKKILGLAMATAVLTGSCSSPKEECQQEQPWSVDRFADIEVLRYEVPGFESLSLQQKKLIYHLTEAALWGRDILWDQNGKYNLAIRTQLEAIYQNYQGDRESADYQGFLTYLKQVWFANGIHHHYSTAKFTPAFTQQFYEEQLAALPAEVQAHIARNLGDIPQEEITRAIFDPEYLKVRVNQEDGADLILTSAGNFYEGVTQAEVEAFYNAMKNPNDTMPVMFGLNSQVVKEDGKLVERVWKEDGMYGTAIRQIVKHLTLALGEAENEQQAQVIRQLIAYYKSGDLKDFDTYSILWVEDLNSRVDFVNGFIESYGDPLGLKGSWESIVNFKDSANTARTEIISANAQWFEDHSPVDSAFRKPVVKGVTAKVITAAILAGDSYPSTPIGINLPNSNWIRAQHGSKSVSIDNITAAYDAAAQGNGFAEEFMWSDEERARSKQYGHYADNVHTDLHECLGHASGQLLPGVDPDALKAHGSTLEEARADLFALYYIADPKTIELGVMPDAEAYKAEYYTYMMNGLMTQLVRILPGDNIEEAHMRNRSLIAHWCYEQGRAENVVEMRKRDGKTYVVINDYEKLRALFGRLLAEVQRIKSTGDYEAGRLLVENYGVKVNPELHAEVLQRYQLLNLAPYKGFVNPRYELVKDNDGNITDVHVIYGEGYIDQMLRYSHDYSALTVE